MSADLAKDANFRSLLVSTDNFLVRFFAFWFLRFLGNAHGQRIRMDDEYGRWPNDGG